MLGYPYKLYFESRKLDAPVVVFRAIFWRAMPWTLLYLSLAGLLLSLAFRLTQQPSVNLATLLGALVVALPGQGLGFILLRLHCS
jgi:hypothetical protein